MPRLKEFPEIIYRGMDKKGEIYTIPDKDPVLFITTMGICKTMSYTRSSFYCEVTLKTPKPAQTPAIAPKEPDNQPRTQPEALPTASLAVSETEKQIRREIPFQSAAVRSFVENKQDLAGAEKALAEAGSIGLDEFKEKIKPKRHRITEPVSKQWICRHCKKEYPKPDEIEGNEFCPGCHKYNRKKRHRRTATEMTATEMTMLDMAKNEDRPKWKCTVCNWEGDNPCKRTSGPHKDKFICLNCEALVVKNE